MAPRVSALKKNEIAEVSWKGASVWLARTGYTGEDGFELVVPADGAARVWEALRGVRAGTTRSYSELARRIGAMSDGRLTVEVAAAGMDHPAGVPRRMAGQQHRRNAGQRLAVTHRAQALAIRRRGVPRLADIAVARGSEKSDGELSNSQPVRYLPYIAARRDIHLAEKLIQEFGTEVRMIEKRLVWSGYLGKPNYLAFPFRIDQVPLRPKLSWIDQVRVDHDVDTEGAIEGKNVSSFLVDILVLSLPPLGFVNYLG